MHRLRNRTGPPARRALAAAMGAGCLLASISSASPATAASRLKFTVTTSADAHDAHPGDGRCADRAGRCTLRAAIEEADAAPAHSAVSIFVPAGYYRLRLGTLTVGASSPGPGNIVIDGAGPGRTVISGGRAFRVMTVRASATAGLDAVQITEGHVGPDVYGGGVYNSGRLTIAGSAIDDNVAGAGGGVDNAGGSLVVTGSSIEHNSGGGWGGGGIQNGGPRNVAGSVLVVSSTITGNSTFANWGGGIFNGQNGHPALPGAPAVRPRVCAYGHCTGQLPPYAPRLVLTVEDSDVSGNTGGDGAGGIASDGGATVVGSVIDNNSGGRAPDGGLLGVGTISGSTISGNTAYEGAAIGDFSGAFGRMTITDSTIVGNHAATSAGVLTVGGPDFITGSTIADNTAGSKGLPGSAAVAMIQGGGTLHLSNSTVAGNTTTPAGGGAIVNPANSGGVVYLSFDTLQNNASGNIAGQNPIYATGTILATNGAEPDCQARLFKSDGYNLATDRSCGLSRPTDLSGVNPKLGPLASNGGPTSTEALLTGSPAINAGGLPATSGCPLTDQRGMSRPWGLACDIGAYEAHYRLPGPAVPE